jgi:L-threonylcarbamoyladenylate synthase
MNTTHTAIRISASDSNAVTEAKKVIQAGGVIVYPTETVYGFGVDATNELAINNLNQIKKRTRPISIIVSNIEMAFSITILTQKQKKIVAKKLKEANTIIVPLKTGSVHQSISGKDNTVGLRIPDHAFGINLVRELCKPITTTSVNISGNPPINDPEEIMNSFSDSIDLFIDEGVLPHSRGSRILKLKDEYFEVIRK